MQEHQQQTKQQVDETRILSDCTIQSYEDGAIKVDTKFYPEQSKRIILSSFYLDKEGEFAGIDEDQQVLIPITLTCEHIIKVIKENIASYINIDADANKIDEWIVNSEEGENIVVATTPYIRMANSDDFVGDVQICIRIQSFEEFIKGETESFSRRVNKFAEQTV